MQLIIIHLIICCIVTYICCSKDRGVKALMYFCLSLSIPVAGYIICLFIKFKKSNKEEKFLNDFEEEVFNKKLLFTDEQKLGDKRKIVSLEEVILINDSEIKKEQLMRCLQDNDISNTKILKLAIKDENIETAHYASVAIIDMTSRFEENLRELREKVEKNKDDIRLISEYSNEIKMYIDSGLIEESKIFEYRKSYIDILKVLIKLDDKKEHYEDIIDSYLIIKDFKNAEIYCNEFVNEYNCEEAYLKRLKYYYELGDKQLFYKNLNELKNSPITLSREGLKALRFWNDEVAE